ncbi:MAG: hypothetical protein N2F24_18255, partial [Deltaproteobacteria bacterium]
MNYLRLYASLLALATMLFASASSPAEQWVSYEPQQGAGSGKSVVFVAAGWEYRAEEGMTMLAKILS